MRKQVRLYDGLDGSPVGAGIELKSFEPTTADNYEDIVKRLEQFGLEAEKLYARIVEREGEGE